MIRHREVPVRVTAWVDEGVASLVVALNEYAELATVDSCEGYDGDWSSVFFVYRGSPNDTAIFSTQLAAALGAHKPRLQYQLRLHWSDGEGEPLMELVCPQSAVKRVAGAVSAYAQRHVSLWALGSAHGK